MTKYNLNDKVAKVGSEANYTVISIRPGKYYGPLIQIRNDWTGEVENVLGAHIRPLVIIK